LRGEEALWAERLGRHGGAKRKGKMARIGTSSSGRKREVQIGERCATKEETVTSTRRQRGSGEGANLDTFEKRTLEVKLFQAPGGPVSDSTVFFVTTNCGKLIVEGRPYGGGEGIPGGEKRGGGCNTNVVYLYHRISKLGHKKVHS